MKEHFFPMIKRKVKNESYVKQYINTMKNQKKLRKDQRMKKLFLMMALLASSAIAVIIVFISIKGIAPFLPNYTYGSVDFLPFITGMTWQDQDLRRWIYYR